MVYGLRKYLLITIYDITSFINLCNFIIDMISRENCIEILAKLHAAFDTVGKTADQTALEQNHIGHGGLAGLVPWWVEEGNK